MTTYTTYTDGRTITASGGSNAAGAPAVTVITNTFDAARRNVTAADVVAVLSIPARSYVHGVQWRTLTADASQTISIGDGDDTDGWISGGDCAAENATGCSTMAVTATAVESPALTVAATPFGVTGAAEGAVTIAVTPAITGYSGGKYYAAADTIDILVPGGKAYDTLKVQVSAVVTLFG